MNLKINVLSTRDTTRDTSVGIPNDDNGGQATGITELRKTF